MAYKRKQIGSVLVTKDEKLKYKDEKGNPIKEFYIKVTEDCSFKKGDFINLEDKKVKLASLEMYKNSMSSEGYEKALERIEKMPDFVKFELIQVSKD